MKPTYLVILLATAIAITLPAASAVQEGHGNPVFIEADCLSVNPGGPATTVMVTRDPFSSSFTLDVAAPGLDLNEPAERTGPAHAGTPSEEPLAYTSASARLEVLLTDLPVAAGAPLIRRATLQANRAGKTFRTDLECTLRLEH